MDYTSKEALDRFKNALVERGYTLEKSKDRVSYYKPIFRHYPDDRAVCQLIVNLYDTRLYGVPYAWTYEPVVLISRTTDERIDINLCHPKRPIGECEQLARKFMHFVDDTIDPPKEP